MLGATKNFPQASLLGEREPLQQTREHYNVDSTERLQFHPLNSDCSSLCLFAGTVFKEK